MPPENGRMDPEFEDLSLFDETIVDSTQTPGKNIVQESDHTVPTIETALQFVSTSGGHSIESWQAKGLGLQMVLLGLAEVQALRISRLAGLVFHLEQKVFDPKVMDHLEPRQLVALYRSAVQALDGSTQYVKDIIRTVNWKDLEEQLVSAYARSKDDNTELKTVSQAMLTILSRTKDLVPEVDMDFD